MRFDSKSVLLNSGTPVKVPVNLPSGLYPYTLSEDVWDESIANFNIKLDNRIVVTETIGGILIDVLRLARVMGKVVLWAAVDDPKTDILNQQNFTLTGILVFAKGSETEVEKFIINNLIYGGDNRLLKEKS